MSISSVLAKWQETERKLKIAEAEIAALKPDALKWREAVERAKELQPLAAEALSRNRK